METREKIQVDMHNQPLGTTLFDSELANDDLRD
jgi:hypothetical protein